MLEDNFGDIIRKARFGKGVNAEVLAQEVGLTSQRLASLEQCEAKPELTECNLIADRLGLHARALWEIVCDTYSPATPDVSPAKIMVLPVSPMQANAYIVQTEGTSALLVDPGAEVPELITMAHSAGLNIGGILLTHGHSDHSGGVAEAAERLGVNVLAHPSECKYSRLISLAGDGVYSVGGYPVQALHCPGHTPQSYAFLVNTVLFTGDTLFAGSLGRVAQAGAYNTLLASAARLLSLPNYTPIFPGHGPASTVAQEQEHNPFLAATND